MVPKSRMMRRSSRLRLAHGSQHRRLLRFQNSSLCCRQKPVVRTDLLSPDHLAPVLTNAQTTVVDDLSIRSPADQGC